LAEKLRISVVQYVNTAPLVYGFTHGALRDKHELSFTIPSRCADDLRDGRADVAIIPAIELQRIDNLAVLPNLAIASKRRVRSLLIVSRKPMTEVRSLALDQSSRSTQALTRILCAERWHIVPKFVERPMYAENMLEEVDAALIIGDPALRLAIAAAKYASLGEQGELICNSAKIGVEGNETLHIYDVVQEWRQFSGLPAVLAIWAVRKEVLSPEIVEDFLASRDYGMAHLEQISWNAARETGLPSSDLLKYLRENINFTLDSENMAGLDLYYCLAAKLGLIPTAKPIEWAATAEEAIRPAKSAAS
jgi:chorismate dehydratase